MSIRFDKVTKAFGNRPAILKDFSFEVSSGQILFILGKSGMGKSVTLKHIVGLLKPDSGAVYVNEINVSVLKEAELPSIRQICGMVFQHPALIDSLTVYENVSFGLRHPRFQSLSEDKIKSIVIEKLGLVHLSADLLDRYPSEISYGMQKRVSLARTLAPGPQYLLFDEPTTGLDPITTNTVNDLIYELSRKLNVTSIVVSHDMGCALKAADRILFLDQGQILFFGTKHEIMESQNPLIQSFLSETLELMDQEHA